MATLNFVKGSIKGRVGQFVGSSWKGIDYIKTYTPTGNPRTEGQVTIRTIFQHCAHIGKAINQDVLKPYTFPKPVKMTAYNRMLQINKDMFHDHVWNPKKLQILDGQLNPKKLQILDGQLKPETLERVEWGAGPFEMKVYWTPDATWQEGQDDRAIAVAHYEGNETTAYGFAARKDGLITMDVSAFGSSFDVEHVYVYLCFARPPDETDKQGQNSSTSRFFFPSAKAAPDAPETPATPAPAESA